MQITSNPYASLAANSPTALSQYTINKTDKEFAALFEGGEETPQEILKKITENGIEGMMKWKIDKLKEEIAGKIMASKNLTQEQIAAMPAEQRIAIEQQIIREVAEKVKEAINEQAKRENEGKNAMIDMYDTRTSLIDSPTSIMQRVDISV
jgi:hypothetical protein